MVPKRKSFIVTCHGSGCDATFLPLVYILVLYYFSKCLIFYARFDAVRLSNREELPHLSLSRVRSECRFQRYRTRTSADAQSLDLGTIGGIRGFVNVVVVTWNALRSIGHRIRNYYPVLM